MIARLLHKIRVWLYGTHYWIAVKKGPTQALWTGYSRATPEEIHAALDGRDGWTVMKVTDIEKLVKQTLAELDA